MAHCNNLVVVDVVDVVVVVVVVIVVVVVVVVMTMMMMMMMMMMVLGMAMLDPRVKDSNEMDPADISGSNDPRMSFIVV